MRFASRENLIVEPYWGQPTEVNIADADAKCPMMCGNVLSHQALKAAADTHER